MEISELRIFDSSQRFGTHILSDKTVPKSLRSTACNCCQIFLSGNIGYTPRRLSQKEKDDACAECLKRDMSCYVHCPYAINLASEDVVMRSKGRQSVIDHLKETSGFPCSCVLHIGAKGTVETVANEINTMDLRVGEFNRNQRPLVLEVCAGEGTKLGKNDHELRHLFEGIDKTEGRVGLCLDTQHLFASGMCDFTSHESVVKLFERMEDIVGPSGINLIHLNDSLVPFGGRKDRHAPLGMGHIWSRDFTSLCSLVNVCHDMKIDVVMETYIPVISMTILADLYTQFI